MKGTDTLPYDAGLPLNMNLKGFQIIDANIQRAMLSTPLFLLLYIRRLRNA